MNFITLLQALCVTIRMKGVAVYQQQIFHDLAIDTQNISWLDIQKVADHLSFKIKKKEVKLSKLDILHFPVIAQNNSDEAVIILKKTDTHYLVQDLKNTRPIMMTHAECEEILKDIIYFVVPKGMIADSLRRFDVKWFIPVIKKYKHLFYEILAASFFIQLVALITPLFFQVVMDKVLVHNSLSTLHLIVIGMAALAIFEITLTLLRSYLFTHTTARIDVALGSKLFGHILNLPISFFQNRRTGETVARVRELENIRSFLTGNAVTLVMDAFFTIIFIAVMFYYSTFLTWIVIGSIPVYFIFSLFITPILRHHLNEKFAQGAENQSFLVESITGVQTLKSMALEPEWIKKWDHKLSDYVRTTFRSGISENTASSAVNFISKITTIFLLWGGVHLVLGGDMTVGQLIAFNMLSGQVAAPIIRIASLWSSFQQVLISVERLGDILNSPTEASSEQKLSPPSLRGDIIFDDVNFRYTPDGKEIIKDFSMHIPAGKVIGLVGKSGSGKSTITKLLQRLYTIEKGRILVDHIDIAHMDIAALRRHMSVVLQENMLFNCSVRDNIALAVPQAPIEKIIEIAKISGAHEFITDMTHGYDTMVGEMGSSLSGGQRQRIALARALLPNPRILILDEATSALDYETESIILKNMPMITKDRTVIIIAHRLSCVRMADEIHVVEQGKIIQSGDFETLLKDKNNAFAQLHQAQFT